MCLALVAVFIICFVIIADLRAAHATLRRVRATSTAHVSLHAIDLSSALELARRVG